MTGPLRRAVTPARAEVAMWVAGTAVVVWVARRQWFVRDDWAFLLTRERVRAVRGLDAMLLEPQDGHWMTWPILVFRAIDATFGLGSYLPYVLVLVATHLTVVALARCWMARLDVSPWTTVLLTGVLLVFGAGWENLLFAVQIVYNLSLAAFLAQLLLVDHDGPVDRRDWAGVAVSLIGVSSSGFGPIFGAGVALLLAVRRRWWALAVAVVPQAVLWSWWWIAWGSDPAGDQGRAGPVFVARFVRTGLGTAYGSLLGVPFLGWAAVVLVVAVVAWRGMAPDRRARMIALAAVGVLAFAGIALRREQFGVGFAQSPRYVYTAAIPAAPVLGVALDQARRYAAWAPWLVRVVLVVAIARNAIWLDHGGDFWSAQAESDRRTFELVAGSAQVVTADPNRSLTELSPDVHVGDLGRLVADGAIVPATPMSPEELAIVARALGLSGG